MQNKQQFISILSIAITLLLIYTIPLSAILPFILLPVWFLLFKPLKRSEIIIFIIASVFIIGQNYSVLQSKGFRFSQQDFLLMPYYEPFMWGFYYVNIKRFISEKKTISLGPKALAGLLLTSACFTAFSTNSDLLSLTTVVSTSILILMFHHRYDLYYGAYALCLGFIIELFGVSADHWSYPEPDVLGLPWWFATMWITVGILGRRFLIPLAEWMNNKLP